MYIKSVNEERQLPKAKAKGFLFERFVKEYFDSIFDKINK